MTFVQKTDPHMPREDIASLRMAADDPDLLLATRWIAGELQPDEAIEVRARYDRDPAFRHVVDPLCVLWKLPGRASEEPTRADVLQEGWHRIRREAGMFGAKHDGAREMMDDLWLRKERERNRAVRVRVFFRAAIFLLLAAPSLFLALDIFKPFEWLTMKRFHTAANQTLTVALPDDSHVTIGPGSSLRYSELTFQRGDYREVHLEGDATFTVTPKGKSVKTSFVVTTGSATIVAVGTVFRVHSYDGEPTTDVEVLEGRVRVVPEDHGSPVYVDAGQRVRVNDVNR